MNRKDFLKGLAGIVVSPLLPVPKKTTMYFKGLTKSNPPVEIHKPRLLVLGDSITNGKLYSTIKQTEYYKRIR